MPSESEIRRAAYDRLRAQAAEHDAISPPPGVSIEDDERAKRRQELQGVLGEPVSPPQEDRGQLLGESRDVPPSGPDDASTEAEIRRAAFERLHAQAAEDEEVSPPRSKQRDEEDERAKKIRDLETMIAERAALGPSDPTSESVIRREAFQRAREEVEEGGITPPLSTPKPPPAAGEGRGEGAQAPSSPISFEPASDADEDDLDTSDWHAAFERLAAQREEVQQTPSDEDAAEPGSSRQDTSEPGPPAPQLDVEGDPDLPSWQQAFDRLGRQHAADDEAEGTDEAGEDVSSQAARGDGPSDTGLSEASQLPPAETPRGVSRSEEFARLRRTAEEENANEGASTSPQSDSESDARRAEFENLRTEAQDLNANPMTPGVTPGTVDRSEELEAAHETSETTASLDVDEAYPAADPETEDRGDMEGEGEEASWELQDDAEEGLGDRARPRGIGRTIRALRSRLVSSMSRGSSAGGSGGMFARVSAAARKETTTLTIEHGYVKLLVTRGREVVDYRIEPASPRFFREGLVSDAPRIAALIKQVVRDFTGSHKRVIAAVPGYQTNLRRIELPNVKGMDPKLVIPNEARKTMGITPDKSRISWHHLPGTTDTGNWLVVSATNRSISSISVPAASAGLSMTALELRPFAVARATSQTDAIFAWTSVDGCDAVVVRDWVPMTYQAAYWGAGLAMEPTDLVNRIVEVVESTIDAHDIQNPEMAASPDIPLYVYGSPSGQDNDIARRVAQLLGRETGKPDIPLDLPDGFPLDDLIVNVGLSLWDF